MKKGILALLLAAALTLTGCAFLPERSYSVVEPYTDRYWDSGAEDTLRAESYQDLVNSLLMLVEERSEEGVIRYYGEAGETVYTLALAARQEVLKETVSGSYLLENAYFAFSSGDAYSTLTFSLDYREDAANPENLMTLSDTQSLADLLRLAVREEHTVLTARFINRIDGVSVTGVVQSLWQELYRTALESEEGSETGGEDLPTEETEAPAEAPPEGGEEGEDETAGETAASPAIDYPLCPWQIHFYPNAASAEIVEILLN